jgi:aspartate carbamoyltransferase catalytic subunit
VKGLLSLSGLSRQAIEVLLDSADRFADLLAKGAPVERLLEGRVVTLAFFEPSTRTRLSFERASKALGADVFDLRPEVTSMVKGESFRDTLMTLTALGTDILILRHSQDDAAELAADWTGLPVVNAGSGRSDHPTQTLLDALTMRRHFGRLDGLRVGIVGDITNSRVAAGLITTLPILGANVTLVGPKRFLPTDVDAPVSVDLGETLPDLDVVYMLRVQRERGAEPPSNYGERLRLDSARIKLLSEGAVVMHPGPVNRGVEITDDVVDGPRSLILEQVINGVPTRMAVLNAIREVLA